MTELYYSESFLKSNGYSLFYRKWEPTTEVKSAIVIIHGFGEHSGRYHEFASSFIENGHVIYALDLRGHGQSEGKRGHISRLSHFLDDIEELLKEVRVTYMDIPIVLFGHSMGGTLVLQFVKKRLQKEISGFIVSSPWISLAMPIPRLKLKIGKALEKIVPALRIPNNLDANGLSHSKEVTLAYTNDPLVLRKISLRLFAEMEKITNELKQIPFQSKISGLVYCGAKDTIIDSKVTSSLFHQSVDIEFRLFTNTKHEPHQDLEKLEVIKSINHWIADRKVLE